MRVGLFLFLNLVVTGILVEVFLWTDFFLGYASSNNHTVAEWVLYSGFCFLHVGILYFYAHRKQSRIVIGRLWDLLIVILMWLFAALYLLGFLI